VAIKDAIQTINRMQSDSVIERYAIGDAVGATFYLEPVATLDVDVSRMLPSLRNCGCSMRSASALSTFGAGRNRIPRSMRRLRQEQQSA